MFWNDSFRFAHLRFAQMSSAPLEIIKNKLEFHGVSWSSLEFEWSVKWFSGVVEWSSGVVEWSSGVVEWSSGVWFTPKFGRI